MTFATRVASTSPIRGPPVTTRTWIELTRPRSASGVSTCIIALRSTALITSAPRHSYRARAKMKPSFSRRRIIRVTTALLASPQLLSVSVTALPPVHEGSDSSFIPITGGLDTLI